MLRSIDKLEGKKISATDGKIGKVKDILFDDKEWTVRYMVAETGGWLSSRKVLISPNHLVSPDPSVYGDDFPVTLTRDQVEKSPPLGSDEPISRRFEEEFIKYYGFSPYWSGQVMVGVAPSVHINLGATEAMQPGQYHRALEEIESSHLRSSQEVIGYKVSAKDESIGKIEDFIVDTESWKLRCFVVDTGGWSDRRKVMLYVDWIESFDWATCSVVVNLTADQIRLSPTFHPEVPINRDYENELCDYYGRTL